MEFVGLISEGETLEQFDHFRKKREDRYNFMQVFIKFKIVIPEVSLLFGEKPNMCIECGTKVDKWYSF